MTCPSRLNDSLKEMTDREMEDRRKARALNMGESLIEADQIEEQYQCKVCNVFCYLSQVTCACNKSIVCVEHAGMLCSCAMKRRVLRTRFSDTQLLETQAGVAERAAIPGNWQAKFDKVLKESARPPLRALRALLAEGDRIGYSLPELRDIRMQIQAEELKRFNEQLGAIDVRVKTIETKRLDGERSMDDEVRACKLTRREAHRRARG